MTVSAKFPPLEINILEKILVELKIANQKESIGMFFVFFSYFFMHAPNFWGIKPLYRHFWKFCSLELMKDINRNSFMPLCTNSDAFQSPKKSVCKFDNFDCPQLYKALIQMLRTITRLDKIAALHRIFLKKGMLIGTTAAYMAQLLSETDSNAAGDEENRVTEEGEDEDEEQGEDYGKVGADECLRDIGPVSGPQALSSIMLAPTRGRHLTCPSQELN